MKRPSFTPNTPLERVALHAWIDDTSMRLERVRRTHPLLALRAAARMINYGLHKHQNARLKSLLASMQPSLSSADGRMTLAQNIQAAAEWVRTNDPPDPPELETRAFALLGLSFAADTVYNRELVQAARSEFVCGSGKSRGWIWVASAVSRLLYSRRGVPASPPTVDDVRRKARCRAIGALANDTREETLRALDTAMRLAGVDDGWMAVLPEAT